MGGVVLKASDISLDLDGERIWDIGNIELREGEIVALVGPNGSGRTSLPRVLAGLAEPSRGRVLVFRRGLPVSGLRVGFLAQEAPAKRVLRPGERATRPGEHASRLGERATRPGEHASRLGERATRPGEHTAFPGERAADPGRRATELSVAAPGDRDAGPTLLDAALAGFSDLVALEAEMARIEEALSAASELQARARSNRPRGVAR